MLDTLPNYVNLNRKNRKVSFFTPQSNRLIFQTGRNAKAIVKMSQGIMEDRLCKYFTDTCG